MQFSTLAVFVVSVGLVAAQKDHSQPKPVVIGNGQPDDKCFTKPYIPIYLKKCHKIDNLKAVNIYQDGLTCYGTKTAGCLDAGKPLNVDKGCHKFSDFPDAKEIKAFKCLKRKD
ncbi:hypothetical protein PG990_003984 [Apiospora arundinis]|uniref:Uncharacterized protein n=1 Tax=Apiospora arundinis TaxID=335852 RepID=A0ABR2IE85_9PEZI